MKKKLGSWLLSLLLVCSVLAGSLPLAAYAAEESTGTAYYLDADTGDDGNTGTSPSQAWKSLAMIDGKTFAPGDRILLKAGTQYNGKFYPQGSGTEEHPIVVDIYSGSTVGSEAGEQAAIHAEGKSDYGIYLRNMQYWTISNLEVSNKGASRANRVGVNIEIDQEGVYSGIHLKNLYVHDVNGTLTQKNNRNGGIYFANFVTDTVGGSKTARFNDISVEGCTVKDVSRTALSIGWTAMGPTLNAEFGKNQGSVGGTLPSLISRFYNTNVVIRNNYVENAGGDAIVPMFCSEPLVEYNISNHACQDMPSASGQYSAAIWPWRCISPVFQFNEAYDTVVNGDGQAYDCDFSVDTLYQYNYSHDNEGGFMLVCQNESIGSVIRYNISQNDKRGVFMASNTAEYARASIYNNTIYVNGVDIVDPRYAGKLTFNNNIMYNVGSKKTVSWGSQSTYNNNLYYGFDTTPVDANKIIGDPLFVDPGKGGDGTLATPGIKTLEGYQLQSGSPAIDAGMAIANNGGRDYFGNALTDGKADIGAAEYVPPVDKSTLKVVLDLADVHVKNGDVDKLIPVAKEKFNAVLKNAQDVYADEAATEAQVDKAWNDLMLAIQGLGFVPGDKTELGKLIAAAKELDLTLYEDGAEKDAFTGALTEAEEVLSDANALPSDVKEANDKLDAAIKALKPIPVAGDKKELGKAITTAESYDLTNYVSDANKTNFEKVLAEAKAFYDSDDKATQGEIDQMHLALITAMNNLRLRADKATLNDWLEKLKALDLTKYSAEDAAAVRAMITEGEAMAAQDLGIDEAKLIEAMTARMEALYTSIQPSEPDPGESSKPDSKPEEGSSSETPDNGSSTTGGTSSGSSSTGGGSKTGDSTPIVAVSLLAVAAAGALVILKKRKG